MEIAALREALRRLAPTAVPVAPAERRPLPTGWASLDAILGGGAPRGQLTEIAGISSSGKTALAFGLLAGQTAAGELTAFIDARRQLYPPAAAALGVDLTRLLVVRPPAGAAALARAAEIVAQSRTFALVVIDLPPGLRLERTPAGRLRAAAHGTGTALLALSDTPGAVTGAAVRLEVGAARGAAEARRLAVTVHKGTGGGPARAEVVLAAAHVPPTTSRGAA